MDILSLLDEYEIYLKNEKKASENTRQSYLRDLRQFAVFHNAAAIDHECVCSYIERLKQEGRSPATVARKLASVKSFFNFCCMRGYMYDNPVLELSVEKPSSKPLDILDSREVELLLAQPQCIDLKGYRDKAMLELLYATGVRVTELISLKLCDVDLEKGTITCGTVRKRTIPLSMAAFKALSEYMSFIRKQMIRNLNEEFLFVNVNGDPLTRQGFWKIMKAYQHKAGIEKNITPHTLRHSFAAHLLQNGSDMKTLQKLMGHSEVTTTGMYAEFSNRSER